MENHETTDVYFMSQALKLAFGRMGATSPNPPVGAIIVKNNRVVSYGATQAYGLDHAEVVAIKGAAENLHGASMYITLEPCCHWGKTPPCTSAIIQSGIQRVVIPMLDPNPAVSGKGVRALQDASVEVVFLRECLAQASDLLRPFKKSILRQKPFIIHKAASSLDGKTATQVGDSKWISSEVSRLLVHRLRSCVDTIIVGKTTFEMDDPRLTIRYDDFSHEAIKFLESKRYSVAGYDNSFLHGLLCGWKKELTHEVKKVILGLPSRISTHIINDKSWHVFVTKSEKLKTHDEYKRIKTMMDEGRVYELHTPHHNEQIHELCDILHSQGSMIVMLEGGASIAGSFFDANEIDQCMYFYAPLLVGNGRSIIEGKGREYIKDSLSLQDITSVFLGNDILISGYRESYLFEAL